MDRLAKKAKLARELGVSYGQLMAMVEAGKITIDLPVKKNPDPALNGRKCVECDKPLVRQQRRFCSDVCREKAGQREYYLKRKKLFEGGMINDQTMAKQFRVQ